MARLSAKIEVSLHCRQPSLTADSNIRGHNVCGVSTACIMIVIMNIIIIIAIIIIELCGQPCQVDAARQDRMHDSDLVATPERGLIQTGKVLYRG